MKNFARLISMVLLIVTLGSIVVPASASSWEKRYGAKVLKIDGVNELRYVKNLQTDLNAVLGTPLAVDGKFDDDTRKAVILFQKNQGLTANGRVCDGTKQALWKAVQ